MTARVVQPWTIAWSILIAIALGIAVTTVRSHTAVDWVTDGRPTWSHVARSFLKWLWVTFVVLRAIHGALDWLTGRTQVRSWGLDVIHRVAVTCGAGLPRFVIYDPMGGVGFCLWYGLFLVTVDGFLQMHPAYHPRIRQAFWAVAFVALIPWGLPSVPTRWPGQIT
jgi:hypothetical protein